MNAHPAASIGCIGVCENDAIGYTTAGKCERLFLEKGEDYFRAFSIGGITDAKRACEVRAGTLTRSARRGLKIVIRFVAFLP